MTRDYKQDTLANSIETRVPISRLIRSAGLSISDTTANGAGARHQAAIVDT